MLRGWKKLVAEYLLPTICSAHVSYTEIISTHTYTQLQYQLTVQPVSYPLFDSGRLEGALRFIVKNISIESTTVGTQTTKNEPNFRNTYPEFRFMIDSGDGGRARGTSKILYVMNNNVLYYYVPTI